MSQIIVGAGLAGLIAACHFKEARIIDAAPGPVDTHQALLRFRSTAVSELTGIPFKKVTVQKGVWNGSAVMSYCSIQAANQYSYKVSGGVTGRSITNLDPAIRYIAPEDFHQRLTAEHLDRIDYGTPFTGEMLDAAPGVDFVSTAPMSVNLSAAGINHGTTFGSFAKAPIEVWRIKLKCPADVYQTIYFPQPDLHLFRASITGDTLIAELIVDLPGKRSMNRVAITDIVVAAFGLSHDQLDFASGTNHQQPFGKIVSMPKPDREALMHELTSNHNIFSLGRFATWRNILLDDVVEDIAAIDSLIRASAYSRKLILSKQK